MDINLPGAGEVKVLLVLRPLNIFLRFSELDTRYKNLKKIKLFCWVYYLPSVVPFLPLITDFLLSLLEILCIKYVSLIFLKRSKIQKSSRGKNKTKLWLIFYLKSISSYEPLVELLSFFLPSLIDWRILAHLVNLNLCKF